MSEQKITKFQEFKDKTILTIENASEALHGVLCRIGTIGRVCEEEGLGVYHHVATWTIPNISREQFGGLVALCDRLRWVNEGATLSFRVEFLLPGYNVWELSGTFDDPRKAREWMEMGAKHLQWRVVKIRNEILPS